MINIINLGHIIITSNSSSTTIIIITIHQGWKSRTPLIPGHLRGIIIAGQLRLVLRSLSNQQRQRWLKITVVTIPITPLVIALTEHYQRLDRVALEQEEP